MAGIRYPDGVSRYAADPHDLETSARAESTLSEMRVPVLHDHQDPASRLFVAYFDGTGNDSGRPDRA